MGITCSSIKPLSFALRQVCSGARFLQQLNPGAANSYTKPPRSNIMQLKALPGPLILQGAASHWVVVGGSWRHPLPDGAQGNLPPCHPLQVRDCHPFHHSPSPSFPERCAMGHRREGESLKISRRYLADYKQVFYIPTYCSHKINV